MRDNRLLCSLVLFAFFSQSMVSAQTCSHVQGAWLITNPPNEGTVTITQTGTTLSGGANPFYCASYWALSNGYFLGSGNFQGHLTNPLNPDEVYFCYPYVDFQGMVEGPGCDTASGTYSNGVAMNAPFSWRKTCDTASGETTALGNWDGAYYRFNVTVAGSDGPNFGGRGVQEFVSAPGYDGCWFQGSIYDPWTTVTNPPGVHFWVDQNNRYVDKIGWGSVYVDYYRNEQSAPCFTALHQKMAIYCNIGGWITYKPNNDIYVAIEETTLDVTRDGVSTGDHVYP